MDVLTDDTPEERTAKMALRVYEKFWHDSLEHRIVGWAWHFRLWRCQDKAFNYDSTHPEPLTFNCVFDFADPVPLG